MVPDGWREAKLGECARIQTGISVSAERKTETAARLPYLRVANVQDGYIDLSQVKYIDIEESRAARYMLRVGDVLFTEGGDPDKLGRGCVWDGRVQPMAHQNHIFAVRCGAPLLPEYLAAYSGSEIGKRFFLRASKQTTNLASISASQLKTLPVPHEVLVIDVGKGTGICATRDGKCLRRVLGVHGPECHPYYPFEHQRTYSASGASDYSAQLLDELDFAALDVLEIERLRRTIRQRGGDPGLLGLADEELVKALRMVETHGGDLVPNVAGLLLVGREELLTECLPTHQLAFQVLEANGDVRVNDWTHGPLVRVLESVEERFRNLNQEREAQVGFIRVPVPDYSPQSFREAVLNAVQHRDYTILQGVHVQMHPTHLFIANPGGFPEGITLDNILVHEPKPRNSRLSEILRRIGLVETTGRGIDKIFLGQLRYGRAAPDYSRSSTDGVRLIIAGGQESAKFAAFVAEQERNDRSLTLDDLLILDHLRRERRIDAPTAGALIQKGHNAGRAALERLTENGLIEARGEKRGRVYHLSAAVYEQLELKGAYVRTKGFDRIRQEAMVLEYVRAHGRIARRDAAELCNVSEDQASRLLRRLADKGKLALHGQGRAAHYSPR